MRIFRLPTVLLVAITAFVTTAPFAHAGEDVRAAVSIPADQPDPLVTGNGNALAQGSYALGTIRLEYTYVGFVFQPGVFATFDLALDTVQNSGAGTQYPAPLTLVQSGSSNLALTPSPHEFSVTSYPWSAASAVSISIPDSVLNDPALSLDGAVLVGNLQLATGQRSKLGTTTSIQVKIRLVHPTACLKQYTFVSDREITADYTSAVLKYKTNGANAGTILNSQPNLGAVAQVVLLVNTCSDDRTIDLRISPDGRFAFGPGNGNTTFVYAGHETLTPGPVNLATLTLENEYKGVLEIANLTVGAGESVLVKVNLVLDPSLTFGTIGSSPFTFASTAYEPGGTFTTLDAETDPNPATQDVPFTLQPQN